MLEAINLSKHYNGAAVLDSLNLKDLCRAWKVTLFS